MNKDFVVGHEVAYFSSHSRTFQVCVVKRVTPSGQIVLNNGLRFTDSGNRIGGRQMWRGYIRSNVAELRAERFSTMARAAVADAIGEVRMTRCITGHDKAEFLSEIATLQQKLDAARALAWDLPA